MGVCPHVEAQHNVADEDDEDRHDACHHEVNSGADPRELRPLLAPAQLAADLLTLAVLRVVADVAEAPHLGMGEAR